MLRFHMLLSSSERSWTFHLGNIKVRDIDVILLCSDRFLQIVLRPMLIALQLRLRTYVQTDVVWKSLILLQCAGCLAREVTQSRAPCPKQRGQRIVNQCLLLSLSSFLVCFLKYFCSMVWQCYGSPKCSCSSICSSEWADRARLLWMVLPYFVMVLCCVHPDGILGHHKFYCIFNVLCIDLIFCYGKAKVVNFTYREKSVQILEQLCFCDRVNKKFIKPRFDGMFHCEK